MIIKKISVLLTIGTLLSACGGSGDDTQADPVFSLSVSDAPVDDVAEVIVCFNSVELKYADDANKDQTFTVGVDPQMLTENDLCKDANGDVIAETRGVNLMEFTGSASEQLLSPITIEAGNYNQLRLSIAEGSYATLKDTQEKIAVRVPSNELKLDGFTAAIGSTLNFTLEFDLRKAMTNPIGQDNYILKPRGVRLVDNSEIGHIEGTVLETLLVESESCIVAPADIDTTVAVVYLYEGLSLNTDTLADNGGIEGQEPLASTAVLYDGVQNYTFKIGFVPAGDYTLSLSCDTLDDPEADDDVAFLQVIETSVSAENTPSTVSFE